MRPCTGCGNIECECHLPTATEIPTGWQCPDCGLPAPDRNPYCFCQSKRYGKTRVSKIIEAYNELRAACRAEGTPRIQAAIDRYEQWADYALQEREEG